MSVKVIVDGIAWDIESWTFPGGERNVRLPEIEAHYTLGIRCVYKGSDDLVDLILVTNAIRHTFPGFGIDLDIPYFPFARQDRVMTPGEANALQAIAQVINMLDFSKVFCTDAHSDVLPALFPPGKLVNTPQWELWGHLPYAVSEYHTPGLVSPDAGAAKKIYKLAEEIGWDVIEAYKHRNPATGEITGTNVSDFDLEKYDALFVVDDICDGGRTFIELAQALRNKGYRGDLHLRVANGIFSKGIEVLQEHYTTVKCALNLQEYK